MPSATRAIAVTGAAGALMVLALAPATGANLQDLRFLLPRKAIAAPAGFATVCGRYAWACADGSESRLAEADILELARAINRSVNAGYRQVTDDRQYGVEELWALPTARGGDCEDFVLQKKLALIEEGVPASRLLIATVLDRQRSSHAVLVLRMPSGDLVLDNLRAQIRPWHETGYSFLRLQNPDAPQAWQAVFAGGIFRDRSP